MILERTYSVMLEVDAVKLFANDDVNRRYCLEHATFRPQDANANEFLLRVGVDYSCVVDHMKAFGCTSEFIDVFRQAGEADVELVWFYA